MRCRPRALNALIAVLFMIGSACFALGTVPAYISAVGGVTDAITYFVGSIFFTSASFSQLLQAQSPEMVADPAHENGWRGALVVRAWRPHDKGWLAAATQFPGTLAFNVSTLFAVSTELTASQAHQLVWVPDFVGSILFLVSSLFAILAVGPALEIEARMITWQVAWLNMIGSIFFMMSAVGSYVLPASTREINARWATLGTALGALCFFAGAALMFPEWRQEIRIAEGRAPGGEINPVADPAGTG
jgi:hypothetical protein